MTKALNEEVTRLNEMNSKLIKEKEKIEKNY
jgi:hypothetical protein